MLALLLCGPFTPNPEQTDHITGRLEDDGPHVLVIPSVARDEFLLKPSHCTTSSCMWGLRPCPHKVLGFGQQVVFMGQY